MAKFLGEVGEVDSTCDDCQDRDEDDLTRPSSAVTLDLSIELMRCATAS